MNAAFTPKHFLRMAHSHPSTLRSGQSSHDFWVNSVTKLAYP